MENKVFKQKTSSLLCILVFSEMDDFIAQVEI